MSPMRRRAGIVIAVTLAALMLLAWLFAGWEGRMTVRGVVRDQSGRPLQRTAVRLGTGSREEIAAEDGSFTIRSMYGLRSRPVLSLSVSGHQALDLPLAARRAYTCEITLSGERDRLPSSARCLPSS